MKPERLAAELDDMLNLTKKGALDWMIHVQTTEHMDDSLKDHIPDDDGNLWTIDECYTEFSCTYSNEPFHLITYELIKTCKDKIQTNNLLFLAPDGLRLFQLDILAPYNIENSAVLSYKIHELWLFILEEVRAKKPNIRFDASEPELSAMPSQNPD